MERRLQYWYIMEEKLKNLAQGEMKEHDIHSSAATTVIPIIQENIIVDKEIVETGKAYIKKRVVEEEVTLNIPVIQEAYKIEKIPLKDQIFDEPPPIRHEGDNMIIPVVREVAEVKIRYEVIEELHVIKTKTAVPHVQQITLLKENVEVERVATEHSR